VAALPVLWLLTEPDRGLSPAGMPKCAGSESPLAVAAAAAAAALVLLPEPQCDSGPGLVARGLLLDSSNVGGPCSLMTFICVVVHQDNEGQGQQRDSNWQGRQ
jgi:hypothetical protein